MRPSHRIDVLTDALLYCGRQAASNLSEWCVWLFYNVGIALMSTTTDL